MSRRRRVVPNGCDPAQAGRPYGNCFEQAAWHVSEHDGWRYIEGTFENPGGGVIAHAWALSPDGMMVWDGERERLAPLFYRQVASVHTVLLNGKEVLAAMEATMKWGGWFRHDSETEPSPVPAHLWTTAPWVDPVLMSKLLALVRQQAATELPAPA